jgi:hypothetical protein
MTTGAILIGAMLVAVACGAAAPSGPAGSAARRTTPPATIVPSATSAQHQASVMPEPTHSSTQMPQPPTATPPIDSETIGAARDVLESADFADPATLDEIGGRLRFSAAGEWAAREVLAGAPAIHVLWAAIWVYGSAGADPAPLVPHLSHEDPSIRTMAAATVVSLGDAAGFAVLDAALADETRLVGSDPPISIRDLARGTLERWVIATGSPPPADSGEGSADPFSEWSGWLTENAADLRFDPTDGRWRLP